MVARQALVAGFHRHLYHSSGCHSQDFSRVLIVPVVFVGLRVDMSGGGLGMDDGRRRGECQRLGMCMRVCMRCVGLSVCMAVFYVSLVTAEHEEKG